MKDDLKMLVVSCDYPISLNEERRASIVVVIWFNNHIPRENGYMYEDGYIPLTPYFIVKKNRFGWRDESVHIPLTLLPKFLENPAGKLDWVDLPFTLRN